MEKLERSSKCSKRAIYSVLFVNRVEPWSEMYDGEFFTIEPISAFGTFVTIS